MPLWFVNNEHEATELTAPQVKIISEWQNEQLIRRKILIESEKSERWPGFIHGWTAALPKDKINVADKILFSLKIKMNKNS